MCSRTRLRAEFKLSSVLYVVGDLFFSLCYALSQRESFYESMNVKVGAFLSRHPLVAVLSITRCCQPSYGSILKLGQHFENTDQFKDVMHNNAIK